MTLPRPAVPTPSPGVFPTAFLQFVALYNSGAFWESHEVLEQPWRDNGSIFYKGLIIFASAFVHVQRGNIVGVRKQMAKVLRYLPAYTPAYMGIHVDRLLHHARRCFRLATDHAHIQGEAVALLIPPHRLYVSIAHVRGDERELHEPLVAGVAPGQVKLP